MTAIPELLPKEKTAIQELSAVMHTIGEMFMNDEGDPALMRTAVQIIRESADVLDSVATRWEYSRVLGQ